MPGDTTSGPNEPAEFTDLFRVRGVAFALLVANSSKGGIFGPDVGGYGGRQRPA
jgi:hypothetical protein